MTSSANADLVHLMNLSHVPDDVQQKFYEAGVQGVREFAAIVSKEDDLRALLKKEFGLDEEASLAERVKVAKVIVAWDTARGRTTKMVEMEAEAEVRGEPKKVPQPDYEAMKDAFEKGHWKLAERDTPSKNFMERRLEMLEKNSLRAEPLSRVLAVSEDEENLQEPRWDAKNMLVAVKVGNKVALPENPEQLRHRLELWGTSWVMASFLQSNRPIMKDLSPLLVDQYLRYLLGKHVMGLISDGTEGTPVTGSLWLQLLEYEHEIRKEAMDLAQRGKSLDAALREAWASVEVKMKHFTEPILAGKRKRDNTSDKEEQTRATKKQLRAQQWEDRSWGQTGKGKGKGKKGKGKGKTQSKNIACARRTPDGRNVCFAFNNPMEYCPGNCGMAHVCGKCFEKGKPMYDCEHKNPTTPPR